MSIRNADIHRKTGETDVRVSIALDGTGVSEIDTGIGGRTAQMVAERIAFVAHYKQVLCITHLPQIASMADTHLYISKCVKGEATVTQVECLSDEERVREIARMASGDDVTETALANAREMLGNAHKKKNAFQKKTKAKK